MDPIDPPDDDLHWANPANQSPTNPNAALPPYGAPPGGAPQPTPAAPPPYGYWEESQAVVSLVLSILGLVFCGVLSPVGWYYGRKELEGIREGRRDPSKADLANAGKIVGIIGTVILALGLLFVLGIVVLAIIGSVAGAA